MVAAIRGCLGINTFQRKSADEGGAIVDINAGERSRERARYCKDDAAMFAVYGQGHCHTVSSVMAAFLFPWQRVLGIDLKYRGGFSFRGEGAEGQVAADGQVCDAPERHQCLEFSTRPSMASFVCDLYYADATDDAGRERHLLQHPVQEACQSYMYFNGQLKDLSGYQVKATRCRIDDLRF